MAASSVRRGRDERQHVRRAFVHSDVWFRAKAALDGETGDENDPQETHHPGHFERRGVPLLPNSIRIFSYRDFRWMGPKSYSRHHRNVFTGLMT